jgi:hypothetical protein
VFRIPVDRVEAARAALGRLGAVTAVRPRAADPAGADLATLEVTLVPGQGP